MERRGLKINMEKTEDLVTGKDHRRRIEIGRCLCGVCGIGVGVNSILCKKWQVVSSEMFSTAKN